MERIYQNCRIRYTLRQEGGKGRANDAAAPGSKVQGAGKLGDKMNTSYEIFFSAQKKKIIETNKRNFNKRYF
jgi:hypothetical protein